MTEQPGALVAVEGVAYHFDKPYGYRIPAGMAEAQPGARVVVPFGRGDRARQGVVLSLVPSAGAGEKPLLELLDPRPLIPSELLDLARWIAARTFCTLYEALRLMLPPGLNVELDREYAVDASLPEDAFSLLSGDEARAVALLRRGPMTRSRLLRQLALDADSGMPDELVRRGLLKSGALAREHGGGRQVRLARLGVSRSQAEALLADGRLTPKQGAVLRTVMERGELALKEIAYFSGAGPGVSAALVKKGVLEFVERRVLPEREAPPAGGEEPAPELSPAQRAACDTLYARCRGGEPGATLLYGVTGSGKTLVFLELIGRLRADGKGIIVLVPEIALTPQTVRRFTARFGADVAVLHSGLSDGERLAAWRRVREGQAHIVVGTRSAVFAPVRNLGLIILDEEQEHTYKSESAPRYHARDVARYRCAHSGAQLLLGSATPAVETAYAARTGRYGLVELPQRYGGARLPQVILVDMKQELAAGNDSQVSRRLQAELEANTARGEQSILLLNRRGYNTFVSCADCGHVLTCPNCSISLTYHADNGRLMCHYCGYSSPPVQSCPVCGGHHLRYAGTGTQRAEETLARLLPGARILRMDTDTTSARQSHDRILRRFSEGKYDILVGTQMVAKGLDFPNVTLVGVLSADQSLYLDDFRAGERTFSLLTQVVGRSGRGSLSGRAVIQTFTPENDVIRLAARQDYDAFYQAEIELRRSLLYPPFCDICEIGFSAPQESRARELAGWFYSRLTEEAGRHPDMPLRLMPPVPAAVSRVGGRFRYKILFKCRNDKALRAMVAALLRECGADRRSRSCAVFADINPLSAV